MDVLCLRTNVAKLKLSTRGAAVLGWEVETRAGRAPLFRPASHNGKGAPDQTSAFPLVPFGNRIGGNTFSAEGRDYRLTPNTGDPYRLHGDGWLSHWTVQAMSDAGATLTLRHQADAAAPWDYLARQTVTLDDHGVVLALSVENTGSVALPFGLGWHPYFPLTPRTRLIAPSSSLWLEGNDHLPTEEVPIPADLDFRKAAPLPDRWINNGFEDWNGCARIDWPERGLTLKIDADPIFSRYVIYRPDTRRAPGYSGDWFCFEPMTHTVDGFRLPGMAGLVPLSPGERLEGSVALTVVVH